MKRLMYSTRMVHLIALAAGIYALYYFWWRATATINTQALLFSLIFLAAEVYGTVNFLLFAMMTWDVDRKPAFQLRNGLTVDVFVPTYNEELDILEPTLIGCRAITYPHSTYVLDDGRRPEVKALAKRLGCHYLTRGDNKHAKAGNLNAALARTRGEFVVVLDADMVPQPDFIDKTLGYFSEERVALVQLPQEFYNLDSMQHLSVQPKAGLWHDQSLFFRLIQPGKNRWNAAFWCGSPSIVRRSALMDVGGVATETITEDIHTTVRLHVRGWKTVYHDEPLAFGIAPATLHAFAVQRLRWAQGSMQLLRSRDNPVTVPGLTLAQRLNYVASILTYFDPYQKLVFLLTPTAILATGVLPMSIDVWEYATRWLPFFALATLANVALGRGHFRYLSVELLNLLKLFIFLRATFTLLSSKPLSFKVTPKRAARSARQQDASLLVPHFVLTGLIVAGVALGALNLLVGLTASYSRQDIAWVTMFWSIANGAIIALGVRSVLSRSYQRQAYRFPARLTAKLADERGISHFATVDDLSANGAGLVVSSRLDVRTGNRIGVAVSWPGGTVSVRGLVTHLRPLQGNRMHVGMQFGGLSLAEREGLLECLYVSTARDQADLLEKGSNGLRASRARWTLEHWGNLIAGSGRVDAVARGASSGAD